jgi:hypothetical protein
LRALSIADARRPNGRFFKDSLSAQSALRRLKVAQRHAQSHSGASTAFDLAGHFMALGRNNVVCHSLAGAAMGA